ncbi:MAG: TIGR03118 family protein, partial [Acidobacteria bacterium]|nr:TIGR03118 family protein [Acidobacteriota bacterium]
THASGASGDDKQDRQILAVPSITPGSAYRQTNLVSDIPGIALIQDPLLRNPWGISMTSSSPFWFANNGTSTASLYRGDVGSTVFFKQPGMPNITIPETPPSITGTVANNGGTTDFIVTSGTASARANFLFASLSGKIYGWSPNVPAAGSTVATQAASQPGHVYTGLAIGNNGTANFLYAADFKNGKIDTFNGTFTLQTSGFTFVDTGAPALPPNFHPFNIQNIGGSLYVAYAKFDPVTGRDIDGIGNGYVSKFDPNGVFLGRVVSNGPLNSPWGMVIAPISFGEFGGALLVGNFGEGGASINAFNPTGGTFLGSLRNEANEEIEIDELWALTFGNGGNGGDPNTLYFSAGPSEEEHGLFGKLNPTQNQATSLIHFGGDSFSIGEGGGTISIPVIREGDTSGSATVQYATFDESQPGHASQRSDYEIAEGVLRFAPGETFKTINISIVDDKFVEGDETVGLTLSNPTGTLVGLGSPNDAELTITDNDSAPSTTNPIDTINFFVRQQYLDFLSREPDTGGFNTWVAVLTNCPNQFNSDPSSPSATCDRVSVSRSFFLSSEFQLRGYFAIRFYRAAYGRDPLYGEFMGDMSRLSAGDEASKVTFANEFAQRNEFKATLDALTNAQYVDRVIANTGVTFAAGFRDAEVAALDAATKTRAQVLRDVVERAEFSGNTAAFNRAFVLSEYFGYLRRDPDAAGFNAWLNFLAAHPGDFRSMVNGFVNSPEYRSRFGTP